MMEEVFGQMTADDMVRIIDRQIEKLDTVGSDDMIRLRREIEQHTGDPANWFDLGIAINQAALQRSHLLTERAQLLDPGVGECDADTGSSIPLYERALEAFHKVLELEPQYYGVWCQIGTVYGNMQRYDDAETCYRRALQEDDEDFSAAYFLGCVLRDKGDEEQARHYFALAHDLNPDSVNCES